MGKTMRVKTGVTTITTANDIQTLTKHRAKELKLEAIWMSTASVSCNPRGREHKQRASASWTRG